ncbi:MAG: DsbE family thiol:disulfide interchange protein [Pseudomonadota bacterium]
MNKFIPILIFALLVGLLAFGLTNDPKMVPSPFIGKAAPEFITNRLYKEEQISLEGMKGKVWLLNVFASWCVSCRAEHKLITELAKKLPNFPIVGLNYKDEEKDAKAWLKYFGNPYRAIAVDLEGNIGIEFGVYGVPETFIIDKKGIIRHKQIGPVSEQSLSETIIPLLVQLEKE